MKIDPSKSLGKIAVGLRGAVPFFEEKGIDYCRDGTQSLEEACLSAGLPPEGTVLELEKIGAPPEGVRDDKGNWHDEPLEELIYHIVRKHHAYTYSQISRIEKMMELMDGPGDKPAEYGQVRGIFLKMSRELEGHLREEEEVVFPFLIQSERAYVKKGPALRHSWGPMAFIDPVRSLLFDHGLMGKEWIEIKERTNFFLASETHTVFLQPFYDALRELANDNLEHIHLENTILLKRAVRMGFLKD